MNIDDILTKPNTHAEVFAGEILKDKRERHLLLMLAPLMADIYQELTDALPASLDEICQKGLLQKTVRQDLSALFYPMIARVLVMEMHSVKERGYLEGETPEARYDHYVRLLTLPQNALDLLNKYPALKEALYAVAKEYQQFMQDFFILLWHDWLKIKTHFFGLKPYQLEAISSSGDKHSGGKSVLTLSFVLNGKSRQKLIYKPRSLEMELAWNNLISWFNKGDGLPLLPLPVLSEKNYGWCGFIDNLPCQNEKEAEDFYYRTGQLLGILHLLLGSDMHLENLIAHGAHPMLIDLECLFHPALANELSQKNLPSVLDTLILPMRILVKPGFPGLDISAISGKPHQEGLYLAIDWEHPGTDNMRAVRVKKQLPGAHNLPTLQGKALDPLLYENRVVSGFKCSYERILSERAFLLSERSPLYAFKGAPIRLVLRKTSDYAKLLFESYHPELWYYPEKRQAHFEWLKTHSPLPLMKIILKDELDDLNSGNIPAFYSTTSSLHVYNSKGAMTGLSVEKSGLMRVFHHLEHDLSPDDLSLQCALIHLSFESLAMNTGRAAPRSGPAQAPYVRPAGPIETRITESARGIFDCLMENAHVACGRTVWPMLGAIDHAVWNAEITDIDLYAGTAGIALSFLYAGRMLGATYQQMALATFQGTLSRLEEGHSIYRRIGAFNGLGGVLYMLCKFKEALPSLDIAPYLPKILDALKEQIPQDESYDIIAGCAGTLLVLEASSPFLPSEILRNLQDACCTRLLNAWPRPDEMPSGQLYPDLATKPLLGFSHGVTGVAYALARYIDKGHPYHRGDLPQERLIRKWIRQAYAYERRLFSPQAGNWPDFRKTLKAKGPEPDFAFAWCHGAPGIGLARARMPKQFHDEEFNEEINAAQKTTLLHGFHGNLSLCHGALGNLLAYKTMAQAAKERDSAFDSALEAVLVEVNGLLDALKKGPLREPGLMLGAAGTGLGLLMLLSPDIPNILLLE